MLRNRYTFSRPLTESEATLLTTLIAWRRGSRVVEDQAGAVVGAIAHPDDVVEFEKRLRELGAGAPGVELAKAEERKS